jgi:hypothetical protein
MANSRNKLTNPGFTQGDLSLIWCCLSRFASEFEGCSSSIAAERGHAARQLAKKIKPDKKQKI